MVTKSGGATHCNSEHCKRTRLEEELPCLNWGHVESGCLILNTIMEVWINKVQSSKELSSMVMPRMIGYLRGGSSLIEEYYILEAWSYKTIYPRKTGLQTNRGP